MERSGGDYSNNRFTQGLSYFSADKMWLQPGGWVHSMYRDAWLPLTANVALSGPEIPMAECGLVGERCFPKWMADFSSIAPDHCCHDRPSLASAAFSSARDEIALRFVNPSNASSLDLTVELPGTGWRLANVTQVRFRNPQGARDNALTCARQLAASNLLAANGANDTHQISPWLAAHGARSFVAPPQSVSVACFVK